MSTPTLGQPITFTHVLSRHGAHPKRREWTPEDPYYVTAQRGAVSGIIVGVRTLSNGSVDYGWDDNPTAYYPDRDGYFTAYLVTYDIRRKPVYVLPEHTTTEGA